MPGVPSNKACERCKKRHLKCDETRPRCQRCTAAGVECPGYVQTRKFIDQGPSVRRRYAPYQESHTKATASGNASIGVEHSPVPNASQSANPHESEAPEFLTRRQDDSSFQLHLERTGLDPTDDLQMTDRPASSDRPGLTGTQPQSPPSHVPEIQPATEINRPLRFEDRGGSSKSTTQTSALPNATIGHTAALDNPYNANRSGAPDYATMISSETPSQRSEREDFQDVFSELITGTEHEIAFLTRHYAEVIGPWLDLSDTGKFFSVYVPIRAINCPSLKYAIAAAAAKQLGRVKGAKSSAKGSIFTSPATTEMYPNAEKVDWFLKAANYYYLAASDLNNSTSDGYGIVSSSAVLESPIEMVGRWLNGQASQGMGQDPDDGTHLRNTEEMLAAIVILTLYKLLDAKGEDWHSHLSGIDALFNSFLQVHQMKTTFFSHGVRASFWNFARQDYIGSYFTRTATHFDSGHLSLWRAAGISIDEQEKFYIVRSGSFSLPLEDQAANGLCWLVHKVVNFLAKSKQSQIAQWTGSPPINPSGLQDTPATTSEQYPDTNTWLDLCFEFQNWFEGVPETFRPCVRNEHPRDFSKSSDGGRLPFPEVFHSLPTCAATMQHYHFGRIALLLNRPPDVVSAPSTAFDRLQGYREVTKEVEYRSREVCGIALGRPQGEVRVYMIPLLFAVGQCLESADEHQIIVDILRGVEADLGWATEFAVQRLQASWSRESWV